MLRLSNAKGVVISRGRFGLWAVCGLGALVGCVDAPVVDLTEPSAPSSLPDGDQDGGTVAIESSGYGQDGGIQGVTVEQQDAGAADPNEVLADAGPACGDGRRDLDEDCDDGNTLPGDGCNGACAVEPFFECDAKGRCTSTIRCGDGKLDPGEFCDDGNARDG